MYDSFEKEINKILLSRLQSKCGMMKEQRGICLLVVNKLHTIFEIGRFPKTLQVNLKKLSLLSFKKRSLVLKLIEGCLR